MFQPVFCYDSSRSTSRVARAEELGCRLVDASKVGTSVHGGNPAIVIYDDFRVGTDRVTLDHQEQYNPPKKTAVMIFAGEKKGHVRGVPNPLEVIEWFTGKKPAHYNSFTGNFRI